MADIESNIDININADQAISAIKQLQAQLSRFYQDLSKTSTKAATDAAVLQSKLISSINATGKFSASMQTVTTTTESFTTALEKNKLSMGEYFRYGASQMVGMRKVFSTEFDTIDKVARERVKTLQTQYIKLGRDANGAMQAIAVRPLKLDMQDLGTQVAMTAQKQQMFNQLLKQGSTDLLNFGKNTQWAGRQLMVGFTIPLSIFGAAAAKEFMKLEEQTLRFQKVYGDFSTSTEATDKMTESIKNLSLEFTKYGIAVDKTIGLAADAAAMGKTGADLMAQVSEATRLSVLGGVEQAKALETTTSLTNAFGVATDKLSGKINFLNAVENQTVTSIDDLTEAIPKAGPVVQQLGGNVEDLAFFMTAMKEGGIDAGEGANALKSGLASMINPTQEATDRLAEFGINLKSIVDSNAGNVKNMIMALATELDNLSDINRAQAIEQLFGKFQFARMSTLFQNVIAEGSQAQRVLQLTQATTEELAVLSERELKKIESSPMYQFQAAVEKFQAALAPVGESFLKAVTPIINFGTDILKKFNEMGDGAKQFWTVVIAAVAGLGPVLLMTFGLLANGAANIMKMFGMMGGIFTALSGQSKLLGGSTQYMTNEQLEAAAIAASLNQVHQNLIQTFTSEATAAYELAAAYRAAATAGAGITAGMVPRAAGAQSGAKKKKYAKGVVMVPGPKGAGDIIPAMLAPGEAVIPADKAAQYGGLIQAMIDGTIPGFKTGKAGNSARDRISADPRSAVFGSDLDKILEIVDKLESAGQNSSQIDAALFGTGAARSTSISSEYSRAISAGVDGLTDQVLGGVLESVDAVIADTKPGRAITGKAIIQEFRTGLEGRREAILRQYYSADVVDRMFGRGDQYTHLAGGRVMTASELASSGMITDPSTLRGVQGVADTDPDKPMNVMGGFGRQLSGRINNIIKPPAPGKTQSTKAGFVSPEEMLADFEQSRADAWTKTRTAIDQLDSKYDDIYGEIDNLYQTELRNLPKLQNRIVETEDQIRQIAEQDPELAKTYVSMEELTRRVKENASKKARAAIEKAEGTITGVRYGSETAGSRRYAGSSEVINRGQFDVPAADAEKAEADASTAKKKRADTKKKAEEKLATEESSQSKKAKSLTSIERSRIEAEAKWRAENNVSKKRLNKQERELIELEAQRIEEAKSAQRSRAATEREARKKQERAAAQEATTAEARIRTAEEEMLLQKEAKKQRRAKIAGRVAGAGMAATVALGATAMVPGAVGEISQALLPAAGIASTILPALISMGPVVGTIVGVLGAVTAGFIGLNVAMDGWRKDAIKLNETLGGGQKAMRGLAEFAGTVTAGEVMDRQRENKFSRFQIQEGKTTFGQSYMQSEAGKALTESIQKQIKSGGMDRVADQILNQMSTAVVSGALSAAQARSVVAEVANELGDQKLGMDINGKLIEFLGPNGENLLTDPIGVRLKIMDEGTESLSATGDVLKKIGDEAFLNIFSEWNWNMEKLSKTVGGAVADQAIALQQNQEMIDSLDQEYAKKIEIAKASGDIAEATRLAAELEAGRQDILAKNAQDILSIADSYKNSTGYVHNQMNSAADDMIASTFEGTQQASAAEMAKSAIKDANLTDQQDYTMRVILGSGDLNPTQLYKFLEVFGKDSEMTNAVFSITTELGGAASSQALEIVNMMEDEDLKKDFLLRIDAMPVNDAQQYMDMLAEASKVGEVAEIEAILKFYAENPEAGAELMADIQEFKDAQAQGPITLDVVQRVFGQGVAETVAANWEYFNSLDKDMQLTYTQTIKTIYQTIGTPSFDSGFNAWLNASGKVRGNGKKWNYKSGNNDSAKEKALQNEYLDSIGRSVTEASASPFMTDDGGGGSAETPSGGGGGGRQTSVLDDILQKLRKVQMSTLALTEGWAGARQALDNLFPGGASNSPFQGIEQQMRRLGAKEDLITMIAGMDPEEFQKRKDELFTFDGAGNIVGFRNSLLSIGAALRSINFGEFQSEQQKNVNVINDQNNAIRKLVANGFSMSEAYDMVKNSAFASAVAQESNNEVIRKATEDYKKATAQAKLFAAAQAAATANQKVVDQTAVMDYIRANAGSLSASVIDEMLNNADYAALRISPTLTSEQAAALEQWTTNIENSTELEFQTRLLSPKGREQIFQDGFNMAMEAFSAQEKRIELEFAVKKDPFQKTIENAQNLIADIQGKPGGLDDLQADIERISDQEEDINKRYKSRLDSLEQIKRSNDRIIQQRRSELTVADAITQGDIAAAAKAIEDARAQQAQASMQAQQEMLQRQQQAEIDALTGQMGMTREQIELRIRDIKNEILNIEETMLEPAQYQLSLLERQEKRQKEALTVLGMTRREWETIKNRIDVAKTSSEEYKTAMERARDVVGKIVEYWTEIQKPKTTVHTIITNHVTNDGNAANNIAPSGDPSGGGPGGNPSSGPSTPPPNNNSNAAFVAARTAFMSQVSAAKSAYDAEKKKLDNLNAQASKAPAGGRGFAPAMTAQKKLTDAAYSKWTGLAKTALARGYNAGGLVAGIGNMDKIRAMLTPGEFVITKPAVDAYGARMMKDINNGTFQSGSVYNYSISVNVETGADADQIANTVMRKIKSVDSKRIQGNRF